MNGARWRKSGPPCARSGASFAFSDALYRDVARLANVQAIKTPAPPIGKATTRIKDGQRIRVDDGRGVVTILDEEPSPEQKVLEEA